MPTLLGLLGLVGRVRMLFDGDLGGVVVGNGLRVTSIFAFIGGGLCGLCLGGGCGGHLGKILEAVA